MHLSIKEYTAVDYKMRVCMAMNFISQNLEKDLSLDEVAAAASFSKFHFHRIFKAVVGETILQFTRRLRLEMAANRLVANTQADITDIALACGFSTSQNFAKAFKQNFNKTPSQYRKSKIGNKDSNKEDLLSLKFHYDLEQDFKPKHITKNWEKTMQARVKEMPAYNVAFVRKIGAYDKSTCQAAFNELMGWAVANNIHETGTIIGIYWDNPEVTPADKCRIDACISINDELALKNTISTQLIAGGSYGVCSFEIVDENFKQAWEEAFNWLIASGYECADKPCYELYHNNGLDDPDGIWKIDICIPLKDK